MSRRAICTLLLLVLAPANAATREQILEIVAPLATALSNGDAGSFMAHIPEDMPDRAVLAAYVEGLLAAALVTSSVRVIELGEDEARLDWYMEIRSRATATVVERRREPVVLGFREGKLTSLQPVGLFRPFRTAETR